MCIRDSAWSTSVVSNASPERNLLRLLARMKEGQQLTSSLIGDRDRSLAVKFGKHLQDACGYQFKVETDVASSEENGDIDVLAYNTKVPSEVLIVECKAVLAADEINEVGGVAKAIAKGQKQLQKIERIFAEMDQTRRRDLFKFVDWSKVKTFHYLVLTPDSEPGPGMLLKEIPAISLNAIYDCFSDKQLKSPSRLVSRARSTPWLDNVKNSESASLPVVVNDWTFWLPALRTAS